MRIRPIIFCATAAVALAATPANATTLILDAGWAYFDFDGVGSSFDQTFDFTLAGPGFLNLTDAFAVGDIFELTINGIAQGNTSTPGAGPSLGGDADAAFNSGYYSRGSYALGAGSYNVSGVATASPFGSGGAYIQLASTGLAGAVPEPATWAFMIFGFGAIGGAMRLRRKANVKVSYA